jgi:hypothetical protein
MPSSGTRPRVLWVSRYLPYPLDTGGKVYSARLAHAVAAAGAEVTMLGFCAPEHTGPDDECAVECVRVPGDRRPAAWTLLTRLPVGAAIDATSAARAMLRDLLRRPWEAIVLDGYATGWALDDVLAIRGSRPTLAYVSHNHEAQVWRDLTRGRSGNVVRRTALRVNARRVAALERRLVDHVDLLTAITDADRTALSAGRPRLRSTTLTPGFSGVRLPERRIDEQTPRRVLVLGSFRWVVKQDNLRRFVKAADEVFQRHGITLDVVGDVPHELQAELRPWTRATRFHGFVDDLTPYLTGARIGVVPEEVGGGFKLKFLDYFFGGLPVATIAEATEGLPDALRSEVASTRDMAALVQEVVGTMDDVDELDSRQRRAFAAARQLFSWPERGALMLASLRATRGQSPALLRPEVRA